MLLKLLWDKTGPAPLASLDEDCSGLGPSPFILHLQQWPFDPLGLPPAHRLAALVTEKIEGVPDDLNQLAHVYVVWDQELGLVQDGKLLFSFVALDDDLQGQQSGISCYRQPLAVVSACWSSGKSVQHLSGPVF